MPSAATLMFAGLTSRCTMPCSCAYSSAPQTCFATDKDSFDRSRTSEKAICESRPLYELHNKPGLVRIFEPVDGRDIGMIQ